MRFRNKPPKDFIAWCEAVSEVPLVSFDTREWMTGWLKEHGNSNPGKAATDALNEELNKQLRKDERHRFPFRKLEVGPLHLSRPDSPKLNHKLCGLWIDSVVNGMSLTFTNLALHFISFLNHGSVTFNNCWIDNIVAGDAYHTRIVFVNSWIGHIALQA